jgi:hypothetical protein
MRARQVHSWNVLNIDKIRWRSVAAQILGELYTTGWMISVMGQGRKPSFLMVGRKSTRTIALAGDGPNGTSQHTGFGNVFDLYLLQRRL